ncbi:MAG TPA: hypothetical protein GXZ52_03715 [Clostridiales bacterium]|jgi:hypothetical protein|nr:hypothetical protein [Clostridiales bacterium]
MFKKENLGDSVRSGGFGEKKFFGRSPYHRHFAGYSEYLAPRKSGKGMRIKRIYTGDTYKLDLPKVKGAAARISQAVLTVAAVWLFVRSATKYLPGNSFWAANLAQAVTIAAFVWELISLIHSCRTNVYTVGAFRDGPRALRRSSLAAAGAEGVLTLVTALFALLGGRGQMVPELLGALRYLIAGGMILVVNFIERSIPYTISSGTNEKSEDSEEIW